MSNQIEFEEYDIAIGRVIGTEGNNMIVRLYDGRVVAFAYGEMSAFRMANAL